jgi:hypothetical protein
MVEIIIIIVVVVVVNGDGEVRIVVVVLLRIGEDNLLKGGMTMTITTTTTTMGDRLQEVVRGPENVVAAAAVVEVHRMIVPYLMGVKATTMTVGVPVDREVLASKAVFIRGARREAKVNQKKTSSSDAEVAV